MANTPTITSANSILHLGVLGLFSTPIQVQGFSADGIIDQDAVQPKEHYMGIDGKLSQGFVYVQKPTTIHLQADSKSRSFFDQWAAQEELLQDGLWGFGTLIYPSISMTYILTNGVLDTYQAISNAGKTLKPVDYKIVWESIKAIPM